MGRLDRAFDSFFPLRVSYPFKGSSKGENTSEFREAWTKIKIPISEILIIIITIIVDWAVKNNK